jgi:hypothetical protein
MALGHGELRACWRGGFAASRAESASATQPLLLHEEEGSVQEEREAGPRYPLGD